MLAKIECVISKHLVFLIFTFEQWTVYINCLSSLFRICYQILYNYNYYYNCAFNLTYYLSLLFHSAATELMKLVLTITELFILCRLFTLLCFILLDALVLHAIGWSTRESYVIVLFYVLHPIGLSCALSYSPIGWSTRE